MMKFPEADTEARALLHQVERTRNRVTKYENARKAEYAKLKDLWRLCRDAGIPTTWVAQASSVSDPAIHDALRRKKTTT